MMSFGICWLLRLDSTCYADPEMRTLTIDVGFYISRYYLANAMMSLLRMSGGRQTIPRPFSTEEWIALLNDAEVFIPSSLEIMKRMLDYGGKATCTQLSVKYGETKNFYNSGSVALARRVAERTGCPVMQRDTGDPTLVDYPLCRQRCWQGRRRLLYLEAAR